MGISTDGKMYASSKVAGDRDRLREQVLKGLGWKLYHLWSTDWYRNRDLGRKRLLEAVEVAIRETREEEKRKSEEAKKLAEKRKKEAEKLAEELRIAKQKELEEQKENEKSTPDIGEDENIEVIPPKDDLDSGENKTDFDNVDDYLSEENDDESEFSEDVISDIDNDENIEVVSSKADSSEFNENAVSDVDVVSPEDDGSEFREKMDYDDVDVVSPENGESDFSEDVVSDVEIIPIEDDGSEFSEDVVSDVDVVSPEDDGYEVNNDSLKSKKEDSFESKEKTYQKSSNNKNKSIKDEDKSKKKSSLSKGFGISSIFRSKKKNMQENTGMDVIKFSKNIEHENELNLKKDTADSKPEEKAKEVKVNDKNIDNNGIKSKDDESNTSKSESDIKLESNSEEIKSQLSSDEEADSVESNDNKSKNSSIKSIFFDNERLENKEHGTIASAIIGKSKLEEEEIETVGGEIMENENPKLHRPTPKDKYVVEPEIVDENSQEDEEKLYENLKFKSNVDLDDEDIHNVASNIVANAFEEVISDVNNVIVIEANIIDEDYYQDYDDENQYAQQDGNISQETSDTSTSVNQYG